MGSSVSLWEAEDADPQPANSLVSWHMACAPLFSWFSSLDFSAGGPGLSMSSICRAGRAWEKRALLTDSGADQIGNLCCSLCELLIQKLLSCLFAAVLGNMTIPGAAGECLLLQPLIGCSMALLRVLPALTAKGRRATKGKGFAPASFSH